MKIMKYVSNFKRYTSYLGIKSQWEKCLKTKRSTSVSQFRHVTRLGTLDRHHHGITELAGAVSCRHLSPQGQRWHCHIELCQFTCTAQHQACQGTPAFQTRLSLSTEHSHKLWHFYNLNYTGFLFPVLHIM